ncbi:MAG: LptF/LptG family permease, partial [Verrucomicrobiota bacterium]
LRLRPLLLPYVLAYALPLGVLTGVLLVLGRMSAQQEITAMRAAGLGLGYVARPVLLLGALGSVLALRINYEVMPATRTAYRTTLANAVRQNPLGLIVPKTFVNKFPGYVFYVGEKNGGQLSDVWVERLDKNKRATELAHARYGRVDFDEQANTLQLTLTGNVIADRRNPADPENFSNTDLQGKMDSLPFPPWKLDTLLGPQTAFQVKPGFLSLDQLLNERHRLAEPVPAGDGAKAVQARNVERMKVEVALHEKAASALTVLTFALFGVPLGIRVSRRETSANLVVAVALALGFFLLTESIHWLEKYPETRPDLLQWAPSALFLLLGTVLFRRAGRV